MCDVSSLIKGINSSANEPSCGRLKDFCVAITGNIEVGRAWINLCLTKSSLTPYLLAVAINSCEKYDGLPVILESLMNLEKISGFVCSYVVMTAAFSSS